MNEQMSRLYEAAREIAGIRGQSDLARALNTTPQTVNNWEARGISKRGLLHIQSALGISASWVETGTGPMLVTGSAQAPKEINLVNNPEYPAVRVVRLKANAGVQGYQVEQEVEDGAPIVFRRSWFDKHGYTPTSLMALKVAGQSMEPTFWEDDLIVINTDSKEPRDGHVYVVIYEGETGVKRMVRDDGQWWLVSDNQDSRRFPRKRCHESTEVIGEVVYKQSERF